MGSFKRIILFSLLLLSCAHTFAQEVKKIKYKPAYLHDTVFDIGSSIIVDEIRFQPGVALIAKSSEVYLDSLIQILEKNEELDVEISYFQKIWPKDMAPTLPFDRANEIRGYLIKKGIAGRRLKAASTTNLNELDEEFFKSATQRTKKYLVEFRIVKIRP